MSRQDWTKFHWESALGGIALFVGALYISETLPQTLRSVTKDNFKLAQVGVTSQVNSPVPLNLRPRTHIPLPTDSRSKDYERYSGYDDYGYDDRHEHHHRHRGDHRGGTVIIINPANQSSYESYSNQDGYIRIIRQQVVK